ncbi:hypothetical protein DZG00_01530 [Clavibacter lycopersici]|uniref:Uncharacterized protein n=1 Tax=Clavibacter lycopersici TaxID=2301718 RepID=A0A399TG04_9MICO|nr:hypothetical protein DZG00_01530 [Clavibacter lycopersici]RIJ62391.1 hypothetical protein DZG02_02055 [Clavibacter lycopersici]
MRATRSTVLAVDPETRAIQRAAAPSTPSSMLSVKTVRPTTRSRMSDSATVSILDLARNGT